MILPLRSYVETHETQSALIWIISQTNYSPPCVVLHPSKIEEMHIFLEGNGRTHLVEMGKLTWMESIGTAGRSSRRMLLVELEVGGLKNSRQILFTLMGAIGISH